MKCNQSRKLSILNGGVLRLIEKSKFRGYLSLISPALLRCQHTGHTDSHTLAQVCSSSHPSKCVCVCLKVDSDKNLFCFLLLWTVRENTYFPFGFLPFSVWLRKLVELSRLSFQLRRIVHVGRFGNLLLEYSAQLEFNFLTIIWVVLCKVERGISSNSRFQTAWITGDHKRSRVIYTIDLLFFPKASFHGETHQNILDASSPNRNWHRSVMFEKVSFFR